MKLKLADVTPTHKNDDVNDKYSSNSLENI